MSLSLRSLLFLIALLAPGISGAYDGATYLPAGQSYGHYTIVVNANRLAATKAGAPDTIYYTRSDVDYDEKSGGSSSQNRILGKSFNLLIIQPQVDYTVDDIRLVEILLAVPRLRAQPDCKLSSKLVLLADLMAAKAGVTETDTKVLANFFPPRLGETTVLENLDAAAKKVDAVLTAYWDVVIFSQHDQARIAALATLPEGCAL